MMSVTMSVVRQPTYALHDRIMGGRLASFLREHRTAGESWDAISDVLRDEHDLRVNAKTLARWYADLEREAS